MTSLERSRISRFLCHLEQQETCWSALTGAHASPAHDASLQGQVPLHAGTAQLAQFGSHMAPDAGTWANLISNQVQSGSPGEPAGLEDGFHHDRR